MNEMHTVQIKKLRSPAKNAPAATLIAHLVHTYADGSQMISGAWFGNDRAELQQRVLRQNEIQTLNVWNS